MGAFRIGIGWPRNVCGLCWMTQRNQLRASA
jgi:hypothetical protein